jgi:predicted transcriptional regulator
MARKTPNVLTVTISTIDEVKTRMKAAFSGVPQGARLSFPSTDLFWRILAPKRWDILQAMSGQGPMTVRGLARLIGRDVKAVHGDVQALLLVGILKKTEEGRIEFPYDAIHVDFMLKAA